MIEDDIRRIVREELAKVNRINVVNFINAVNANARASAMRAAITAYDRRRQLGA